MGAFVTTYVIFWLVVALYVVQLGGRQRQIRDRIASLQLQLNDPQYRQIENLES